MINQEPYPSNPEMSADLTAECKQAIDQLAEKLPLSPVLIEALKPDKFLVHSTTYRPYDELYLKGVPEEMLELSKNLLAKYHRVSLVTTLNSRQANAPRHVRRPKFTNRWQEEEWQYWQKSARLYARYGIAAYELLSAVLACDRVNYYPEVQPDQDMDLADLLQDSDPELVDEKGELHESRIAALLVGQGKHSTSQNTLNVRFEHAMAVFQVCTVDSILWQVDGLLAAGGKNKRQKIVQVFEEWKQLLPEDNLYGKVELLTELANIVEKFADAEQDARLKGITGIFAKETMNSRQILKGR